MEVNRLACKLVYASMEVHEFPLSVEVKSSVTSINCSFHEYTPWKFPLPSMYTYMLPFTSTSITNFQLLPQDKPKPKPKPNSKLELPSRKLASSKSIEVDESTWKQVYFASIKAGATDMEASMEVGIDGRFHGS